MNKVLICGNCQNEEKDDSFVIFDPKNKAIIYKINNADNNNKKSILTSSDNNNSTNNYLEIIEYPYSNIDNVNDSDNNEFIPEFPSPKQSKQYEDDFIVKIKPPKLFIEDNQENKEIQKPKMNEEKNEAKEMKEMKEIKEIKEIKDIKKIKEIKEIKEDISNEDNNDNNDNKKESKNSTSLINNEDSFLNNKVLLDNYYSNCNSFRNNNQNNNNENNNQSNQNNINNKNNINDKDDNINNVKQFSNIINNVKIDCPKPDIDNFIIKNNNIKLNKKNISININKNEYNRNNNCHQKKLIQKTANFITIMRTKKKTNLKNKSDFEICEGGYNSGQNKKNNTINNKNKTKGKITKTKTDINKIKVKKNLGNKKNSYQKLKINTTSIENKDNINNENGVRLKTENNNEKRLIHLIKNRDRYLSNPFLNSILLSKNKNKNTFSNFPKKRTLTKLNTCTFLGQTNQKNNSLSKTYLNPFVEIYNKKRKTII